MWSFIEKTFNRKNLSKILHEVDEFGDNFLHIMCMFPEINEPFELLLNKIKVVIKGEEKIKKFLLMKNNWGANVILKAISIKNEMFLVFLIENLIMPTLKVQDFIYGCDNNGENIFHILARFGTLSMIEYVVKTLKNNLTNEEFKNFLKFRTSNGKNHFHLIAIQNENEDSINYLETLIKESLGKEEVRKMLSEYDNKNTLPLHDVVRFSSSNIFNVLFLIYKRFFSKTELKKFFEEKENLLNKNVLELARDESRDSKMHEFVFQKL